MAPQLHKLFSESDVIQILEKYQNKEILLEQAMVMLGIKRRRFFDLLKRYREEGNTFTLRRARENVGRKISQETEVKIIEQLTIDKQLIENRETTLRHYNYSYVKERLNNEFGIEVSVPTIIDRAKKTIFTKKGNVPKKLMTGKLSPIISAN